MAAVGGSTLSLGRQIKCSYIWPRLWVPNRLSSLTLTLTYTRLGSRHLIASVSGVEVLEQLRSAEPNDVTYSFAQTGTFHCFNVFDAEFLCYIKIS